MKILEKSLINLTPKEYYLFHLSIINIFSPVEITPKEREVLAVFLSFTGERAETERFSSYFRKKVKIELKLSDGGLTNHITSLKNKGAIVERIDGTLFVSESLLPEPKKQLYQFKILQG